MKTVEQQKEKKQTKIPYRNTVLNCPETVYNSQRDNKRRPLSDCFLSIVSEFVNALNGNMYLHLDDILARDIAKRQLVYKKNHGYLWKWINKKTYPSQIFDFYRVYLKEKRNQVYNCRAIYKSLTFEEIKVLLQNGQLVIIGTRATRYGHIIGLVGYSDTGFICEDPNGDWNSGYSNPDGEMVLYKFASKIWTGKIKPAAKKKYNCLLVYKV